MLRKSGTRSTTQQEHFGDLFLHAVVHIAGCVPAKPQIDDDSIDWTLSYRTLSRRPKLDVQMKTITTDEGDGDFLNYPLKRKNYDDLIRNVMTPRILVLVTLPRDAETWLSQSKEQLVLRGCAYWVSLSGKSSSNNEISITIPVPRTNLLTVSALQEMMHNINNEKGSL
jgi:Domain of unknown function (DUF4365)